MANFLDPLKHFVIVVAVLSMVSCGKQNETPAAKRMTANAALPTPVQGKSYVIHNSVNGDDRCLQSDAHNYWIEFQICDSNPNGNATYQQFSVVSRGDGTYTINDYRNFVLCHVPSDLGGIARQVETIETSNETDHLDYVWAFSGSRVIATSEIDQGPWCWDRRDPDNQGRLQIIPCNGKSNQNYTFVEVNSAGK